MYKVTKKYGHECGLSATFRQWRAKSHCRFMHGYALSFELVFQANDNSLDENGWVYNFGALKPMKAWLENMFDHKTLVAEDDPALAFFQQMAMDAPGYVSDRDWNIHPPLIQLNVVEKTGCEAFAKMVYDQMLSFLSAAGEGQRVQLTDVTCAEHAGNSATYSIRR